jgi:hypothetical protein
MDCSNCNRPVPAASERCPHCGEQESFPNVRSALDSAERAALDFRYHRALASLSERNCLPLGLDFQAAVARSQAVIARPLAEVQRLAASDKQGYATYYQMIEAELRLPDDSSWDWLRRIADEALFPGYKENIRFSALSLDGRGLSRYGECFVVLKDSMIARRTSVFEENSAVFVERQVVAELPGAVRGRRAAWGDRSKLAVAKVADRIDRDTTPEEFPRLLLHEGSTPRDDDFLEAHTWGPLTVRSFERVVTHRRVDSAIGSALKESLQTFGVSFEERAP